MGSFRERTLIHVKDRFEFLAIVQVRRKFAKDIDSKIEEGHILKCKSTYH